MADDYGIGDYFGTGGGGFDPYSYGDYSSPISYDSPTAFGTPDYGSFGASGGDMFSNPYTYGDPSGGGGWGNLASGIGSGLGSLGSGIGNFLTSPGGLFAGAGLAGMLLDNKPKVSQTSYLYPGYTTGLAGQIAGKAGTLLNTPTQGYTGALQTEMPGQYTAAGGFLQGAANQANAGAMSVPEGFNAQAYMNPYISSALDPVAKMMKEDYARQSNTLAAQAGMHGAFGADRNLLESNLLQGRSEKGIGDLYATGLGNAFNTALGQFNSDQNRKIASSGALTAAGNATTNLGTAVNNVNQGNLTMPYQEFLRGQQAPYTQLGAATSALGQLQGAKPTEVVTPPKPSIYQQLTGLGLGAAGLNQAYGY